MREAVRDWVGVKVEADTKSLWGVGLRGGLWRFRGIYWGFERGVVSLGRVCRAFMMVICWVVGGEEAGSSIDALSFIGISLQWCALRLGLRSEAIRNEWGMTLTLERNSGTRVPCSGSNLST